MTVATPDTEARAAVQRRLLFIAKQVACDIATLPDEERELWLAYVLQQIEHETDTTALHQTVHLIEERIEKGEW